MASRRRGDHTSPTQIPEKPPKIVLIAKALFPQSLHITLPAAQILSNPDSAKHVKDFTDAVHQTATMLVKGETPSPDLVERLNVEYSSEMKQMIRDQANNHFEARIED